MRSGIRPYCLVHGHRHHFHHFSATELLFRPVNMKLIFLHNSPRPDDHLFPFQYSCLSSSEFPLNRLQGKLPLAILYAVPITIYTWHHVSIRDFTRPSSSFVVIAFCFVQPVTMDPILFYTGYDFTTCFIQSSSLPILLNLGYSLPTWAKKNRHQNPMIQ